MLALLQYQSQFKVFHNYEKHIDPGRNEIKMTLNGITQTLMHFVFIVLFSLYSNFLSILVYAFIKNVKQASDKSRVNLN